MKTVSWVLLVVAGVLVLLGSLFSMYFAYAQGPDEFGQGGTKLSQVAEWNPEVATAIRGRRVTASAYAASFAILLLFVAWGPYRRREVWAWWAVLVATLVPALLSVARVSFLETRLGVGTALTLGTVVLVALLLDVGRLQSRAAS